MPMVWARNVRRGPARRLPRRNSGAKPSCETSVLLGWIESRCHVRASGNLGSAWNHDHGLAPDATSHARERGPLRHGPGQALESRLDRCKPSFFPRSIGPQFHQVNSIVCHRHKFSIHSRILCLMFQSETTVLERNKSNRQVRQPSPQPSLRKAPDRRLSEPGVRSTAL
jgi:hypothetical protein